MRCFMLENKLYNMNIKYSYELVNNINCLDNISIDDNVIVVNGDKKINLFSNEKCVEK